MKKRDGIVLRCSLMLLTAGILGNCFSQNPIIHNQFTADPTARVFGDTMYLYPSHDILAQPGKGQPGWFCMKDYHVFASADLVHWRDGGVLLSQYSVPWADTAAYSMWAPDCIEKGGRYYFYFPTKRKSADKPSKFAIGVAVSQTPVGPFKVQPEPIAGVDGIDPNVFIDDDGQAYLYWAQGNIMGAKLKADMLALDSEVKVLQDLPKKGLKEGPFVFKKGSKYYLTYPHVEDKTERLEYAVSDSPLGPFQRRGVIMEASANCWTNHQSIVRFKGQWYLFYHSNDYSPSFDKARSVRIDSLFFNADGTIREVKPTFRGVGLSSVKDTIQIDRYSKISGRRTAVNLLDAKDPFKGWALSLDSAGAWVRYDHVDFGAKQVKAVRMRVKSDHAGQLLLKAVGKSGNSETLGRIRLSKSENYVLVTTKLLRRVTGERDLILSKIDDSSGKVDIDWMLFQ